MEATPGFSLHGWSTNMLSCLSFLTGPPKKFFLDCGTAGASAVNIPKNVPGKIMRSSHLLSRSPLHAHMAPCAVRGAAPDSRGGAAGGRGNPGGNPAKQGKVCVNLCMLMASSSFMFILVLLFLDEPFTCCTLRCPPPTKPGPISQQKNTPSSTDIAETVFLWSISLESDPA